LYKRYNLSKLLLLYVLTKVSSIVDPEVAKIEAQDTHPIVINSLDPCFCKTGLGGGVTGAQRVFRKVFSALFARTAEEGSRLIVIAASAGRETHGKYMRGGAVQEYAPFVTNKQGIEKSELIWEALRTKLEQLQPGVVAKLNT
jgi:retinol dehydrogenase 12